MTQNRQNQVDRFFRSAKIGAVAWTVSLGFYLVLIALGAYLNTGWIWLNYGAFLVSFFALITQYRSRGADEFTQEAWNSASTAAFVGTVAWMLFALQIEGLIGWAITLSTGQPFATAYAQWWAFQIPMTVFHAVFWYRQWRG